MLHLVIISEEMLHECRKVRIQRVGTKNNDMRQIFLILLAFMVVSCNKQRENSNDSSTNAFSDDGFKLKNSSAGKFEVFGTAHNAWMDYIASNAGFSSKYDEDMFDLASTYSFPIIPKEGITYTEFKVAEDYSIFLSGKATKKLLIY